MTTVNDCWLRYRDNHLDSVADPDRQRRAWAAVEPWVKTLPPDGIRPHHIKAYMDEARGSPATKARNLTVLRAALNWNHKNGYVDGVSFIRCQTVKNARTRVLDEGEIVAVLDAISLPVFRDFVAMLFLTAQRSGAVVNLTWDRVDLARGTVDFREPSMAHAGRRKGRAKLPVTGQMRIILERRRNDRNGDLVFHKGGRPLTAIARSFRKACADAGVEKATLHTLRHTAATMAIHNGASLEQVQAMLAHKDQKTTQENYAHLRPEFVQPALDALKVRVT